MVSYGNISTEIRSSISCLYLAAKNLIRYRRRSLNMLLGFLIGSALISSYFIWENVAQAVAVRDSLADRDIEVVIKSFSDTQSSHLLDEIKVWLQNESVVEQSFVIYSTVGVFGSEGLDNSYEYSSANATPLLITATDGVQFIDSGFCETIASQFRFEGSFSLQPGNALISKNLARKIEPVLQQPIIVGSQISFAYGLQSESSGEPKLLGDFQRVFVYKITVAGIFQRTPRPNLSRLEYNPETFAEDALILPREIIPRSQETILEHNYMVPKLFIRLDREYLSDRGFTGLKEEVLSLKSRIRHQFPQVNIKTYLDDLQNAQDQFESSRAVMVFLLVPIVLLAACFTYFAVEIVVRGRTREMAILRVRGAKTYQVLVSFILEFAAVTIVGLVVGVFIGRMVAALVPAATGFLVFDFTDFSGKNDEVPIPSVAWLFASLFCIVMVLVPLLLQIRKFLSADISESMGRSKAKRRVTRVGSLLMPTKLRTFLPIIAVLLGTFVVFLFLIETGILAKYYGTSRWRVVLFALTLLFWIAFTGVTARILAGLLPTIKPVLQLFLGTPAILAAKSLRRGHTQVLSLIIILTMTFSVGVFSMVNGETLGENSERQLRYLVGSDFKIRTSLVEPSEDLFLAQEPGIARLLPIYSSYGYFNDYIISIIGVDPITYSEMAIWDQTSFAEPTDDHKYVLSSLGSRNNGIILNPFLEELMGTNVGDSITIYQLAGQLGVNVGFKIVGVANSLPGFGSAEDKFAGSRGVGKNGGMVVVRKDLLEMTLNVVKTGLFLAKAQKDFNPKETANRLRTNPDVLQVFSLAEIPELQNDLTKVKTLGIVSVGFIVAAGIGMLSLTIFMGYLVGERKEEYMIMLSCGATRRQVVKLILSEFAGIVSFSFLIGSIMGITFSWIYLKIAGTVFSTQNVLPIKQVVPIPSLILACILVTLLMLIGTYFPARSASRSNVALILRSQFV